MTPTKIPLTIYQGTTFRFPFYWFSDTEVVVSIASVTRGYPTTLVATGHLLTERTPVSLIDVFDSIDTGLDKAKRVYVDFVDIDTLTLNADTSEEDAYAGGGYLIYNAAMDLSVGWHARMQIRAAVDDDTVIAEFLSDDGTITLGALGKIEPNMLDTLTDALDFSSAVYDLELVEDSSGDVFRVAYGPVKLSKQTTR